MQDKSEENLKEYVMYFLFFCIDSSDIYLRKVLALFPQAS